MVAQACANQYQPAYLSVLQTRSFSLRLPRCTWWAASRSGVPTRHCGVRPRARLRNGRISARARQHQSGGGLVAFPPGCAISFGHLKYQPLSILLKVKQFAGPVDRISPRRSPRRVEHPVDGVQQLAHHSHDGHRLGLALLDQVPLEGTDCLFMPDRHLRRHIQGPRMCLLPTFECEDFRQRTGPSCSSAHRCY